MEGIIILEPEIIEVDFREVKQFKFPDGSLYEIHPVKTKNVKFVFKFLQLQDEINVLQRKNKKDEKLFDLLQELLELGEKIIGLSIFNVETGESIPEDYLTNKKIMFMANNVVMVTTDYSDEDIKKAGGNPLELRKMLSNGSKVTSSPSKKKVGRRKKS